MAQIGPKFAGFLPAYLLAFSNADTQARALGGGGSGGAAGEGGATATVGTKPGEGGATVPVGTTPVSL
ncbi:hypothetical protein EAH_00067720 [Eimeria acervulina]|uniref:Uncharacterized protein n=1 Tax=Eimeria acervulina TaxID=5801 RepID=U6GTF0_EIMAC|nr:hypothetical protein EAH_00067720 [Eimeria acervulina]CDI82852.1 hypothetical protein EAH_00067720 [Eimeria acervulina]